MFSRNTNHYGNKFPPGVFLPTGPRLDSVENTGKRSGIHEKILIYKTNSKWADDIFSSDPVNCEFVTSNNVVKLY